MSGQVGWYPDPGGQPGMFRHWNGTQWSQELSPTPHAPPPGQWSAPTPTQRPQGAAGVSAAGQASQARFDQARAGQTRADQEPANQGRAGGNVAWQGENRERRGNPWWWVLGGGVALTLIIAAVIVIPQLLTGRSVIETNPGGTNPTPQSVCPPRPTDLPTAPPEQPADGRVHAGRLSYPELGSPWSSPTYDERVPFGRDTLNQTVVIESLYSGNNSWVASVLIAELAAGDGFFSPEQGASIVTDCIVGTFYGDADVTRDDLRNEAITIDGREGWIVESDLSFEIPNLQTTGERLIVVIVRTSEVTSALYYASIPDTAPDLLPAAEDLIDELQVED